MSPKVDAFVDKHGWQIVVFLVTAGVMWGTMNAALAQKAEKQDVDKLRADFRQESANIQRDLDAVTRMLCRDPRNANDSACP